MNEQYSRELAQLFELARDIEKNPSQLHCNCKHKDAPQTPDFDWDVFVNRIDTMMKENKVKNDPYRKVRLALDSLNADLTYENRSRAKALLHDALEVLFNERRKFKERDEEEREQIEQEKKGLLTSTYLTDEFWQNIVTSQKKCSCQCQKELKGESSDAKKREYDHPNVLEVEKRRYDQFKNLNQQYVSPAEL